MHEGSRVVRSAARANATGITSTGQASIEECSAHGNTDDGIRAGTAGIVRGNLVTGNLSDGIEAAHSNRIEDNEATFNSGVGIRVTGVNNLVVRNSAAGNAGGAFTIAGGNKVGATSVDPTTANPWVNFSQ